MLAPTIFYSRKNACWHFRSGYSAGPRPHPQSAGYRPEAQARRAAERIFAANARRPRPA